ncbi:MAG TPA: hypothetical protein VF988_01045 [Verrucomicrobiae bacterium]
MKSKRLLAALTVAALVGSASAQSYSIDWYKIAGGGGASTGGVFSVSGTIGQLDATANGAVTGGGYSLTGGFWAIQAVQTPGAPTLFITRAGSTVTVFWQNVPGWNLYQNPSLTVPSAGWTASTGITANGGTNYLTLTNPVGNQFFRLK